MSAARRLLVVDASGLVYRAFFAIPSLRARSGVPTNAVFGFIRMMRQLTDAWQPTHVAVVFDGGPPAERLALLPEYKAQRPPMPDDLRRQFPAVEEYLDCARLCRLRVEEQEADDVMASLAAWAQPEGAETLIATSDKDLYQIVGGSTWLVTPGSIRDRVDEEAVRARTGVAPGQIVDWLALAGDAVDNIPGVPGVGPKTAARLLNEFGSIEGIWAGLDRIRPERLRGALASAREQVETNRQVARVRRDLDCAPGWERLIRSPESAERLGPFYRKMEFDSLARTLEEPRLL